MKKMTGLILSACILSSTVVAYQGDIHGRDLSIPGFGWLGHTGVEASNGTILEMLNEEVKSKWGYSSQLHKNSKNSFEQASTYWGAKYSDYLLKYHLWRIRDYVVKNADFIEDVGANYTITTNHNHPYNFTDSRGRVGLKLGKYRCDTYVKSMYRTGGIIINGIAVTPEIVHSAFKNKR